MSPDDRFYFLSNDFRDPFSRDRDRVIHSSSFRRLEYKTQVFLNSVGDYYRTRLTHSLEVSQIARSIAKNLGLNESLAEVIALSHDLGHTPFGHAGGDELDKILKKNGFINGFEHNFQSFRVVTKLEKKYKEFDGLNLTYATLEGILKHSKPYRKPFMNKELDIFNLDYHPSLEAIIVDYADEIAYITHDIDDGIKCGLVSFDDLKDSELVCEIIEIVKNNNIDESDKIFRYRFSGELINNLVYLFLDHSKGFEFKSGEILCSKIKSEVELDFGFCKETKRKIKQLKAILYKKLYKHELIARKMQFGKHCIKSLFEAFMNDTNLLPKEYLQKIEQGEKHHRVASDYIASMSDRFATEIYQELFVGR